ncbi:hypothetical protein [Streptomyces kanasensis]|uniref:hypothetical protein n=1 Tax=Streptomyces kanasensis TaxID=936756 RepID=UPI00382FB184
MPVIQGVAQWAAALLLRRRPSAPQPRPRIAVPGPHRRVYTLRHAPPAWSAAASTGRHAPPAHLPRAAAWPHVLVEDRTPVRPYVLPPHERVAAQRQGGAR